MINTPTQPRPISSEPNPKRHFAYFSAPASPVRAPASPTVSPAEEPSPVLAFIGRDTTVTMARVTYFFDDGHCGGFLSIPHLGRHGSAHTAGVARILERWLVEKTSNPESNATLVPILEEPIESITQSIIAQLKADGKGHLSSLAKVAIHVNTGHSFTLDRCCEDEGVQWAARRFQQEYPLFLDLTIHTVPMSSKYKPPMSHITLAAASPFSATAYACASFDKDRSTEILLHFQKINPDDE
ncbi:hypothetical protein DSO57_1008157 [Entomophthora muscae]|uniref:Uncharacterized protein n=1 Tax=Entomophthora muscae TaxID=34485 RepID=A0ACC2T7I8_9FUNG|nr:hypothetical protein DSO57_1008157 [Entomophthora muscae]